ARVAPRRANRNGEELMRSMKNAPQGLGLRGSRQRVARDLARSWGAWPRASLAATAVLAGLLLPAVSAPASEIPSPGYYSSYSPYYEGRFVEAGKSFRETPAMVGVNGKWVDSIPRYTMMGECHYQLGQYNDALDAY